MVYHTQKGVGFLGSRSRAGMWELALAVSIPRSGSFWGMGGYREGESLREGERPTKGGSFQALSRFLSLFQFVIEK
jgi:hypothetical protein